MGIEEHLIFPQVGKAGALCQIDKIHRRMGQLRGGEQIFQALPVHPFMPFVQLGVPDVVVILQDTDLCFVNASGDLLQPFQPVMNVPKLPEPPVLPAGIVQNAVPVDFRSHRTGAPAEVAHIIRAVGDGLHGPERHLAGPGRGRFHTGVPAVCSGLLLHDAEIGGNSSGFRQIPAPFPVLQQILFTVIVQAVGKIRIGIVGDKIQALFCHPVVVQISEQAVGGDEIIRLFVLPDDLRLQSREPAGAVRNEAQIIQHPVGIGGIADGGLRHIHLAPGRIGLVPEHRAPGLVQRLDGAVFFLQKFPEGDRIAVRIKFRSLAV